MNAQAAMKTAALVLALGAVAGYAEWGKTHGGTDEQKTLRAFKKCVAERNASRTDRLSMSRQAAEADKRIEAECRALGNQSEVPQLGK